MDWETRGQMMLARIMWMGWRKEMPRGIYLLKTKRSPRSETLWWLLSNAELVRSGVPAAESSTINEKRTKTLAKNIVEISFINPSLRRASEGWDQILKEQLTCPIRFADKR
jgi:hypothetical protein